MSDVKIYGIKNCDTMKKAFKWLEANGVPYEFHDYKKLGVNENVLKQALIEHGWETVINKRGTTWRQLDKNIQDNMNDNNAIKIALENASIIKRPLLVYIEKTHIGFKQELYTILFEV